MQGNPSYKQNPLHFWQRTEGRCCNGETPAEKRTCQHPRTPLARRLDRSSAESEAMEAASRLQLIAASCSAIPD
ncbi:hypothetical protein HUG20_13560 [Salicibibacter cibi]|uniref:Uncharacterized protein n=1 Tax=Salicibibacter cibi TaxID=2743001 RepID=A0A7T6ZC61_9BACI|nr:hypothetical protein [Salicibibacter cibi]QQK80820.1 hypothetical protein HUG20_13560 [Salicibibacter cibi]